MNIKDEFVNAAKKSTALIKCAFIITIISNNNKIIKLKTHYSQKDYKDFLEKLNTDYNPKTDTVLGYIWLSDGSWIEKSLYPISYWHLRKCPEIPENLKSNK